MGMASGLCTLPTDLEGSGWSGIKSTLILRSIVILTGWDKNRHCKDND